MGKPLPATFGAFGTPPASDRANAVVFGQILGIGPQRPFAFVGPFNLTAWASVNTALTTTNGSTAFSVVSGTGLAPGSSVNSVNVPQGATVGTFAGVAGTLLFPILSERAAINSLNAVVTGIANTTGLLGAGVSGTGIAAGITVAAIVTPSVPGNNVVPAIPGVIRLSATPTVTNPAAELTFALTSNSVTTGTDAAAVFAGTSVVYVGSVQLERTFDGGATWVVCNIGGSGDLAVYAAGTPVSLVVDEPESMVPYRINCTAYTSGLINYRLSTTGASAQSLSLSSDV